MGKIYGKFWIGLSMIKDAIFKCVMWTLLKLGIAERFYAYNGIIKLEMFCRKGEYDDN